MEVVPNAVSLQNNWLPDEMRIITSPQWDNNILTIPDLNMSADNLTGRCKFYMSNDPSGNEEVCEEIDCERDASGNKTNMFKFRQEYTNVYFYGKEVNDFHTLDKNQIFALHHSAIQELSRRNDTKTQIITELQTKVSDLETKNTSLTNELEVLKSTVELLKSKVGL